MYICSREVLETTLFLLVVIVNAFYGLVFSPYHVYIIPGKLLDSHRPNEGNENKTKQQCFFIYSFVSRKECSLLKDTPIVVCNQCYSRSIHRNPSALLYHVYCICK